MLLGYINTRREAIIKLSIFGPRGTRLEVEVVIDTGFTGQLTLPQAIIQALALNIHGQIRAGLADGSSRLIDVYEAHIDWEGQKRRIMVGSANTDPLAGMALLDGHELFIQIKQGGTVSITPLSP